MVKWCNGVTKYAFTLVWCYGEMNMLQWCREYTQVHMVKWWNTVMKWCNNKDLNLIMLKWCNKYGEMVQRIHTSSHGEMLEKTSGDILFTKWQNDETVILTFIIPLFRAPLRQRGTSLLLDSISWCIQRLISGQCCIDCLIFPQAATTPFHALSHRCFRSIHLFLTFLLPPPTSGGFVHLFNLLVISVSCCSYNDNILHYLCATVTYTTLTGTIWYLHDCFAKVCF